MKLEDKSWTPSSIALTMAGVVLIGMGLYFISLRPPLLPEDVRYMALPAAQLDRSPARSRPSRGTHA